MSELRKYQFPKILKLITGDFDLVQLVGYRDSAEQKYYVVKVFCMMNQVTFFDLSMFERSDFQQLVTRVDEIDESLISVTKTLKELNLDLNSLLDLISWQVKEAVTPEEQLLVLQNSARTAANNLILTEIVNLIKFQLEGKNIVFKPSILVQDTADKIILGTLLDLQIISHLY